MREHVVASDDAAALHGARIEVQERQGLSHQHLWNRKLALAQLIGHRKQVEVPIGLVHQFAAKPAIEGLEHRLRVEQERVPSRVVAIDMPAAAQGEIDFGEALVQDRTPEVVDDAAALHQTLLFSGKSHCSMARFWSTRTHGRSARSKGRATRASTLAMRPAVTKRSLSGKPSVRRCVISESSVTPAASSACTWS